GLGEHGGQARLVVADEVGGGALLERLGLADVEDLALGVLEDVDPRAIGEVADALDEEVGGGGGHNGTSLILMPGCCGGDGEDGYSGRERIRFTHSSA